MGAISGHNIIWRMSQYELVPYRVNSTASEATKTLNETYLTLLNKALTAKSFYFRYIRDFTLFLNQ